MKQANLLNEVRCWGSKTSGAAKTTSGFSLFFACALMILLLQGLFVNSVFGQGGISVHTTDIRANFGIDADLYARRLMFPPLYPGVSCNAAPILGSLSNAALLDSATSDDWFNPNPANPTGGVGIIDTSGMAAFRAQLIACGSDAVCLNAMIFKRMAYPSFTVVPYATGVNVFLDAVAVRDHNAIAAAIDSSAFCATADKNIHNPQSWCMGVAGTPAKDDIVDVAAHIRQNVVNATSPLDTGLWGYAYATTMTANGDSHLDFELIRCIDYSGAAIGANEYLQHPAGNINSAVMFCGPDSGHTAGHHSMTTGAAIAPGDVLLTVDYSCGGKKTDLALYVWSDTSHVGPDDATNFSISQYNTIPGRLFDFTTNNNDPTTDPFGGGADYFFNSAGTAPFGYIRIRPKTNDTIFWARVNVYRTAAGDDDLDTTLGPPYGSLIGGAFDNNIQQLQEVEIALNFTKAGLAIPPSVGPCQQIFGNLLVKTRTSTSVTSELKDYVGPVQFGAFTNILLEANGDTLDCDNPSVTLCAHASATQPGNITYCWQGPDSPTGPCISGPNDSCITVSVPGTYYISATLDGGCTTIDSVVVVGNVDETPPTITCPANTTMDCPAVVIWGTPTASDNVDQSVDITVVSTTSSGTCPVVHTRTWIATDDCGNTATCSSTITVRDITAPSITCPANTTIDCPAVVTWGTATANDACDQSVDVIVVSTVPSGTCPVVHTRTWRATDDCGNTNTCSATITVRDIVAPSITCPANTTIDCPAVVTWGTATANDACDQSVDVIIVSTVPSGTCPVVHTRTWRATDDCGNTNTCSATITVRDITAPSLTCPANTTIDCPAVVTWGTATASDACDQSVDVIIVSTVPSGTCPVVHTRTWRATDDCGNTNTCSATITVRDITAPSITCPANTTLDCPAVVTWGTATASDACDASVDVTIVSTVPSGICPVVHTRTWRATDDCGNTSTCSATITVRDIVAPTITCPANTTIDCPAVISWGTATASDACDQSVDVIIVGTTPSGTCPVVLTRTWRATDDCGNTNTCSASITVRDNAAPSITCPANTTIDCPAVVTWGTATASDACDESVDITVVSTVPSGTCPVVHTRTWRATDDCGNTATCSATITVRDIVAPSITCPANTTIDCPAVVTWGTATANDACDQSVDVIVVSTVPSGTCPVVHTRTWRATDDCGNTNTCSATITVRDIVAPSITCPANTTIDCPAVVTWGTATANDACDQSVDVIVVSTVPSGTCPVVHTRTWRATDDCGNTNTCSATITVRDIVAPSITCPANTTIDCPAVVTWGTATANDACDQSVDVIIVSTVPSGTCPVVHTRTWRATDDCGNTNTCSATITVRDITAPSLTCPANTTIDCPAVVTWGTATASDACDQSVDVIIVSTTPSGTCPVVNTRIWRATDDCGNTNTCSATITVRDITAPSITCPANTTIDCPAVPAWGNATASDFCDQSVDVVIVSTTILGVCPTVHTRIWRATDDCGNTSTCNATITVRDITPPTITCAASTTINCPAEPTWPDPTASDACDQNLVIGFVQTTTNISCGTYNVTRVYRATDDCNNTATCSRTVSVVNVPASCSISAPETRPVCGSTGNVLCATNANAVSYQWKIVVDPAPYTGLGWSITANGNTACMTYTAGSSDSVHFRLIVTNACGCKDSCDIRFGCSSPYFGCTLGFWKNHTNVWDGVGNDAINACIAAAITAKGAPYSGNGSSGSLFRNTFGLTAAQMTAVGYNANLTMLQALALPGGAYGLLARSGVAALLNSCGLVGQTYFLTADQVLTMVHDAVALVPVDPANANRVGEDFQKHNETQPEACPPAGRSTKDPRLVIRNPFGSAVDDENISISAYPNPFTSSATIEFALTKTTNVSVEVFDLNGKKVADLYKGTAEAGLSYQVQLNGNDLPPGIYIYRINAGDTMYNDRLILIK